jgi:hypothetical protein
MKRSAIKSLLHTFAQSFQEQANHKWRVAMPKEEACDVVNWSGQTIAGRGEEATVD